MGSLTIMKKLHFVGVGFKTTQNTKTKMSIVNTVQKIPETFFSIHLQKLCEKTSTQRKTKIRFNILSLAIVRFH